jgi:uncharacterized protein
MSDYSQIDRSPLLRYLFYPRRDFTPCPPGSFDLFVPVEPGVSVATRFYEKERDWPRILYFHGNGEVASDYDEIAPFYHSQEINLVVADYRGYGASEGSPTFTHLIQDGRRIFEAVIESLTQRGWGQGLWIMGRSLGSINALDLAFHFGGKIKGVIIESGFFSVTRLITHLGLPSRGVDLKSIEEERLAVLSNISVPALVIHGEKDILVPLREAKDLFVHLGSKQKKLVTLPHADHNSLLSQGMEKYFDSIREFVKSQS